MSVLARCVDVALSDANKHTFEATVGKVRTSAADVVRDWLAGKVKTAFPDYRKPDASALGEVGEGRKRGRLVTHLLQRPSKLMLALPCAATNFQPPTHWLPSLQR